MFSQRASSRVAANFVKPMLHNYAPNTHSTLGLIAAATKTGHRSPNSQIFTISQRHLDFSKFSYKSTADQVKFRAKKNRQDFGGGKVTVATMNHYNRVELPREYAELSFANGWMEDHGKAKHFALERRSRLPTGYMNDFPPC